MIRRFLFHTWRESNLTSLNYAIQIKSYHVSVDVLIFSLNSRTHVRRLMTNLKQEEETGKATRNFFPESFFF